MRGFLLLFLCAFVCCTGDDGLVRSRPTSGKGTTRTPSTISTNTLRLSLVRQQARETGHAGWYTSESTVDYPVEHVAVLVYDVYESPLCRGVATRTSELAIRINTTLTAARERGLLVIHSPTGGVQSRYGNHPAMKRAYSDHGTREPPQPQAGLANPPSPFEHQANTTDFDCGCSCDTYPLNERKNTGAQHPDVYIDPKRDVILDIFNNATLAYNLLVDRKIDLVLVTGVLATNPLPNPVIKRLLTQYGINVAVIRDLVDITVNPYSAPYLNYRESLDLAISYLEKFWTYSTTLYGIVQGAASSEHAIENDDAILSGAGKYVMRVASVDSDQQCPPRRLMELMPLPKGREKVDQPQPMSDTVLLMAIGAALFIGVLGAFAAYRAARGNRGGDSSSHASSLRSFDSKRMTMQPPSASTSGASYMRAEPEPDETLSPLLDLS